MESRKFFIDCTTKGKNKIIRRLSALKTTIAVTDLGVYQLDTSFSCIGLESAWDIDKLDQWLWKGNFDYIEAIKKDDCSYIFDF